MKTHHSIDPLEKKLRLLIPGYQSFHEPTMTLVFRESPLNPDQVLERLNREVYRYEKVRLARAELSHTLAECRRLEAETRAFCHEASQVLQHHCGSDAELMAKCGLKRPDAPPKKRTRRGQRPDRKECSCARRKREPARKGGRG